MSCTFDTVLGNASVGAAGTASIDLGSGTGGTSMVAHACHADGSPAPFRMKHAATNADFPGATGQLCCTTGEYEFTRPSGPLQYFNVLGLSAGTLITVSYRSQTR